VAPAIFIHARARLARSGDPETSHLWRCGWRKWPTDQRGGAFLQGI